MKDQFSFVALDIETTGFDFIENEIIEIGAVRFEKGKEYERFSIFIKPQKKVPKFIKRLTNITDEQLASGENLINALTSLLEFIQDDIVVCHNTTFDIGFINAKLKEKKLLKISNQILDTLDISRIYLPFILNHKLGTVADYFKIDLSNAHRAIFDAIATGNILISLIDFILKNIPMRINHRIFEVSNIKISAIGLSRFLEQIVAEQKQTALLSKQKSGIDFHNRNYIEHKPRKVGEFTINSVFGKDGVFSEHFDKYELREGQIDMANAVLDNFEKKEFLLVEAGTGVGKSLAYLIPSIKYSNQQSKKVVISTNTKNLQEQLFYKDLPVAKDCISIPFKATLLKGRGNYICEKRWLETAFDLDKMITSEEVSKFKNLFFYAVTLHFFYKPLPT